MGNVGARRLVAILASIEEAAARGDLGEVRKRLPAASRSFDIVDDELDRALQATRLASGAPGLGPQLARRESALLLT